MSGDAYAGESRPAVIIQDDRFDATVSVTACAFTTDAAEAHLFRLPVTPNERNGLRSESILLVDEFTTVSKEKLGKRIGRLGDEGVVRLTRAIPLFLGLA